MKNPLLLTPIATAEPYPLQTGRKTTLTIVCSSLHGDVDVSSITLYIPIGTNASDLTASSDFQTTVPAGWSLSQNTGMLQYTTDADHATLQSVTFIISNITINDLSGVCRVAVTEVSAPAGGPMKSRSGELEVKKGPPTFHLGELHVVTARSVDAGGTVTLTWSGSPATYSLMYEPSRDGTIVHEDVSGTNTYTSRPLTRYPLVAFVLTATHTEPGSDQPTVATRETFAYVNYPPPKFDEVKASVANDMLTIEWKTEHADHVTFLDDAQVLPPNGSLSPLVPDRLDYTLRAVNMTQNAFAAASLHLGISVIASKDFDSGPRTHPDQFSFPVPAQSFFKPVLAASPDGSSVYCGSSIGRFRFDGVTLRPLDPPPPSNWPQVALFLAVAPSGSVYSMSGMVLALDASLGGPSHWLEFEVNETPFAAIGVAPDGASVYVAGSRFVRRCDPRLAVLVRMPPSRWNCRFLTIVGGVLYFIGMDGPSWALCAWDAMTLQPIAEVALPAEGAGLVFSAKTGMIYVAMNESIAVLDPANLAAGILQMQTTPYKILAIAATPGGRQLVVAYERSIDVLDVPTFGTKAAVALAFPDGAFVPVAMCVPPNALRVFVAVQDAQNNNKLITIGPGSATVTIHSASPVPQT
jgi:hypothetical protein